jgi:hypothetical protein
MLAKHNVDGIPSSQLAENIGETIDVNFIINIFSNISYTNNFDNSYDSPPYVPNNCSSDNIVSMGQSLDLLFLF